jgi:hypothetical protein
MEIKVMVMERSGLYTIECYVVDKKLKNHILMVALKVSGCRLH